MRILASGARRCERELEAHERRERGTHEVVSNQSRQCSAFVAAVEDATIVPPSSP